MKTVNLFLSGPLLCAPMQIGALQFLAEQGIEIGQIYASDGGILPALLIASGYNLNIELLKAIKGLSGIQTIRRNPWTFWLSFKQKPLKKIQVELSNYLAKSSDDMKYDLTCYFYDLKNHKHIEITNINENPMKLIAPYDLLKGSYKIDGKECVSAEIDPSLFYIVKLPENTIHLRGQLDMNYSHGDVFSNKSLKKLESLSSFSHIPTELANKTIFLRSSKTTDLNSFWGLTGTMIETLVKEGYSLAKEQYKEIEEQNG